MSNVRPAPFFLNERVVAAIVDDRPGPRLAYLPFLGSLADEDEAARTERLRQECRAEAQSSSERRSIMTASILTSTAERRLADPVAQATVGFAEPCFRCGAARHCAHRPAEEFNQWNR